MNKTIDICPFRTYTEVRPAMTVGHGDVTVTGFMPCLKDKCPAWRMEERYSFRIHAAETEEHCKRLEGGQ